MGADDSVTGNYDGDGVAGDGAAYGLGRHGWDALSPREDSGDFSVGGSPSERDGEQEFPDASLEWSAARAQRWREVWDVASEVEVKPVAGLFEDGELMIRGGLGYGLRNVILPVKPKAGQRCPVAREDDGAERGGVGAGEEHGHYKYRDSLHAVNFSFTISFLRCSGMKKHPAFARCYACPSLARYRFTKRWATPGRGFLHYGLLAPIVASYQTTAKVIIIDLLAILIHLLFNLIESVEEAPGGDCGAHQENAEDVPAEHVPPGGVWAFDAEGDGLGL